MAIKSAAGQYQHALRSRHVHKTRGLRICVAHARACRATCLHACQVQRAKASGQIQIEVQLWHASKLGASVCKCILSRQLRTQVAQALLTRSYLRDLSMLRAAFFNPRTPVEDLRRVQQHLLEQAAPLSLLSMTVRFGFSHTRYCLAA